MFTIRTERLEIVAATRTLLKAEMSDRDRFADILGAVIPSEWPPATAADAVPYFLSTLEAHPHWEQWLTRYVVLAAGGQRVLVGSVGFLGAPDEVGMVEIGYSVLPEFQGRGIAGEMVGALVRWAFEHQEVRCVEADTEPTNIASWSLLARLGFSPLGAGREPGSQRLRLVRGTTA